MKTPINRRKFIKISAVGAGTVLMPDLLAEADNIKYPLENSWQEQEVITTCNQCYLGCGLIATVRNGRVAYLRGNPSSPTNRGHICAKAHAGVYKLYHPERIGYPLMRVGKRGEGKWQRISWEEAIGKISKTLTPIIEEYGPQSVALWQNVDNDRADIFQRFIYALGSPNYLQHTGAADAPIGAGTALGPVALSPDYKHTDCMVIVGANPLGCKELCWSAREIIEAKQRGATLITIDPRLSETAAHSTKGLWLPIRPGTDGILLAGFANYLITHDKYDKAFVDQYTFGFDKMKRHLKKFTIEKVCRITDIPEKQFLNAIHHMIGKKTSIDVFSGVSFQKDGAYAGMMVTTLATLLGSIDQKGGVRLLPYPRVTYPAVEPAVSQPSIERIDSGNYGRLPMPFLRRPKYYSFASINQNLHKNILTEKPYPLKAMFICSVNPVYSMPNSTELIQAFDKLDLLVSIDAFMSETSIYADIVLPGSTFLENMEINDVFPPFKGAVMRKPVVKARLESKSSQDIIIMLAKGLGLEKAFPFNNYEAFLRQQLEDSAIDFDELYHKGFHDLGYETGEALQNGLDTPSGRIELYSSFLAFSGASPLPVFSKWQAQPDDAHSEYPLHMISYRLPYHANSRTASNLYLNAIQSENPLLINTKTAKALGIQTGDSVKIDSKRGTLTTKALLTEGIHPETVALSYHFGHKAYSKICANKGVRFNDIASDGTSPVTFGITINDTMVKVAKA